MSEHASKRKRKPAGERECVRCAVVGWHGAGQTYCQECHRKISRALVRELPEREQLCTRCGLIRTHGRGQTRCKVCRAELLRISRIAAKMRWEELE